MPAIKLNYENSLLSEEKCLMQIWGQEFHNLGRTEVHQIKVGFHRLAETKLDGLNG